MSEISNANEIVTHLHCGLCMDELPSGETPQSYTMYEVGFTPQGIQIWCKRHDCNVVHLDFDGHKFHANESRQQIMGELRVVRGAGTCHK